MFNIFQRTSFFRAPNSGVNDRRDQENWVKCRYLVYKHIQGLRYSENPSVRTDMFKWWEDLVYPAALTLPVAVGAILLGPYKASLPIAALATIVAHRTFRGMGEYLLLSQYDLFLLENYEHLGPQYKQVLTNFDFRYAATELDPDLTLQQMKDEVPRYFRI